LPDLLPGWEQPNLAEEMVVVDFVECRCQVRVQDPHSLAAITFERLMDRHDRVMA
jgi:hypothetical protein